MTETTVQWGDIDVQEDITSDEQKASNEISLTSPVGKFLARVIKSDPVEKTFNAYSCHAAKLEMRVEKVINAEQVLVGENGKVIMHNGQEVKKIMPVPPEKMEAMEALLLGQVIKDEILLFHPSEKSNTKKRRLFVAKKVGILSPTSTMLTNADWAGAVGKYVIVSTAWNVWADKVTQEPRRNVKVEWDGYEAAPQSETNQVTADKDLDASFNTDEFDGI